MLAKLSIRNMKRSLRDYGIFVLTLTISFSLIYAYNLICYTPGIMKLSEKMEDFRSVNLVMSVVILFVVGWLINYIIRFMIDRRGREFGIYLLLGIKNGTIYLMFFIENILLCIASLLMGIFFGTLLYQVLDRIIMKVFEVDYRLGLAFSPKALGLTAAYAACMMLFSLFSNCGRLRKRSICSLLYSEKKNEILDVAKKSTGNIIGFIAFSLIGLFGMGFLNYITKHDSKAFLDTKLCTMPNIIIAILCIIVFIYGSYISMSPAIIRLFLNGKRKYKGYRMVLVRGLAARMNTMRFTLGNLAILITLTFLAIQTGMLLKGFLEELYICRAPFDVMVTDASPEEDFGKITNYLQSHEGIREKYQYIIYDNGSADIAGFFEKEIKGTHSGSIMKYSDYVKLRKMLGYSEPVDGRNGYIMQCINSVKDIILKQKDTDIIINGRTYPCLAINTEGFALEGMNGVYFVIVVPDEAAEGLGVNHKVMAVSTIRHTTEATERAVKQLLAVQKEDNIKERITVKGALKADNNVAVIILSFAAFYIALIFVCVVAAIMAIRQLGDLLMHGYHYRILSCLGVTEQGIDGLILRQMLFHFTVPLLLSIPASISLISSIGQIFNSFVSKKMMYGYMAGSLAGFGFIYFLYFVLTYQSFVKGIRRNPN